jgi:twitching motility two-component system response regulator PilH
MAQILIVDDSATDRHAIKAALTAAGHDVEEAISVADGMEVLKKIRPDAIIMDVVMEGTSGFQATRKLSKDPATAGIPVIIVSSKGQETDRIWGMRQGASEYLVKPVNAKQLVDAVASVLKTRGSK